MTQDTLRRADLTELVAFTALAEHLNFRRAAARLGVTPSALSHTIRQLEDRLGVRLFHRTTRSVALTEAGLGLIERVRPAIAQIADALDDVDQSRGRPAGTLRIYATSAAAVTVIAPVLAPTNIVADGFDAGIGPPSRAAADMIAVRVMGLRKIVVVGAPDYLARHPPPHAPEDLADHSCIQYRLAVKGPLVAWSFERDGQTRSPVLNGLVTVNSPELAVRAAADGLGLAYVAESLAAPLLQSGQLVRVLDEWSPALFGMVLYYPGRRRVPAALRALIDKIRAADTARGTVGDS